MSLVFHSLREQAGRNGGTLSTDDIGKVERAFCESQLTLSPMHEETYNSCMASLDGGRGSAFGRQDLLTFYIFALTGEALLKVASVPAPAHQQRWKTVIARNFSHWIRENSREALDDRLAKVYYETTWRQGRALSGSDLISDPDALRVILREIDALWRRLLRDPAHARPLRLAINDQIWLEFDDEVARDCLVTDKMIEALLSAISVHGHSLLRGRQAQPEPVSEACA